MFADNQPNSFAAHPSVYLSGDCGYAIDGNTITLNIEAINNDRSEGNLSGTLLLELRASRTGDRQQHVLTHTVLGTLAGQCFFPQCQHLLPFEEPPVGQWQLSLQLREWDGAEYQLVDSMTFACDYVVEPELDVLNGKNVIEVAFGSTAGSEEVKEAASKTTEPEKAAVKQVPVAKKPAAKKTVARKAPVSNKASGAKTTKATAAKNQAPVAKAEVSETNSTTTSVNVNSATLAQLQSLAGVSRKLAEALVEGRPYYKAKDLLEVKGLGKKTLEKILLQLSF
ncbi:helix-hairpin-helix domain-containing protein [Oceanobacter kriegii]|uniref:helix-hairpin-helix domain-containing protein n=1 Tax=Oceanobacter kriegii TaxID=64972 RepID=UPI0003FA0CEB|nr:helix-hairpin-helix domain-containing protein [Oceanobacter kriegii]